MKAKKDSQSNKEIEEPKRKLPFWIKKGYIQNKPKVSLVSSDSPESPKTPAKTTVAKATRRNPSIFKNTPFREPDPGLMQ
jgi:hypothetical protein